MRSLVISIFLYACESWTLTADLEKRTQAFEMRCYRRLLNISYKDHVTNEEVRRKIQAAIGGGAMVLGKLPVPGRPTIWITIGQGPTALVVGAGGGFGRFYSHLSFSLFFLPLFGRRPDID